MMSDVKPINGYDDRFRKTYSLRRVGDGGASIATGLPKDSIKRTMRSRGYDDLDAFLADHVAAVYYDETEGLEIKFEKRDE